METRLYDVTTILPMFKTRVAGQMAGAGEMGLAGTGMSSGGSGPGGMMGGMESGMGGMAGGMGGMEGGMMGGMAAGGAPATGPVNLYQQVTPVQQLLELIQDITSPTASWQEVDGEGGRIGATETHLIIRQSRRGHEAIVDVLEQLQQTAAGGGY